MTPPPVMAPVRAREPILGWLLVGAGLGFCFLAMLTIGAFVLPFVLLGAVLLGRRHPPGLGAVGAILAGWSVAPAWLGWLFRHGPGQYCEIVPGGSSCEDLPSPWPWYAAAALALVAGAALILRSRNPRLPERAG